MKFQLFSFVRIFLYPFALIYGAIVWLRNRLYDTGFSSSVSFSIPVITVGNLSVGGTGKTPHVEYLIRLLQYRFNVATMSRGYKRRTQGFLMANENTNALKIGDEPMQYHLKFPEIAVSVAEERMTGIPYLVQSRPDTEVILLDDAFQHRSVKAGMNILITDYSRPFYSDYILPYGRLREGRSAYKRADIIIVSKCPPQLTQQEADAIKSQVNPLAHQHLFFSTIRYEKPYDFFTNEVVELNDKYVVLVCCIARPEPLVNHVEAISRGIHVLSYPDHHYFVTKDMEEIKAAFENWDVADKVIVTTEKDAARMHLHKDKLNDWGIRIVVLPIVVEFLLGKGSEFDQLVTRYTEKALAEHNGLSDLDSMDISFDEVI